MKASKALKRLAKIEALMSDVVERYVTLAPAVRKALHDAMAGIAVAKDAVSLDASSGTPKKSPVKKSALKQAEAAKPAPMKNDAVKAKPVATAKAAPKATGKITARM